MAATNIRLTIGPDLGESAQAEINRSMMYPEEM